MHKNLLICLVLVFALTFGLAAAKGVELSPATVVSVGKEIMVPEQAIDAAPVFENRMIVSTTTDIDKIRFQLKGCEILHELSDATAISCPPGVFIKGAREDRIFTVHDLEADVQINADDVWNNLGYDGNGVTVAILDTGVETTHIELSGNIAATENFVEGSSDYDTNGHGTHVSGIVTADGGVGISGTNNHANGVAPGATIIVGKVCGSDGCWESDIEAGIEWAVDEGADVLSMSLGGGNYRSHCDSDPLAAKVNWAVEEGLVVTVSAGNEGRGVSSPACASGAIAVGAVDKADIRPRWSNYGEALDIVAPGVDILSTYSCIAVGDCTNYWYAWMSGTSMSAPHVAGVAALILDKNPDYTVDQVKEAIYNSAVDLGATGWDKYYGYGRVDAYQALLSTITDSPAEPVLNRIDVSPASTTLEINDNQQFTATGYDQYNEVMTVNPSWTSDDLTVGTIETDGLFIAVSAGSCTVTATSGSVAGTATVTVNPAGGLLPKIDYLDPSSISAGSSKFKLTVTGENFVSGAKILWDGGERKTVFLSSTQLRAWILASDVTSADSYPVTVQNPDGSISNVLEFTVDLA